MIGVLQKPRSRIRLPMPHQGQRAVLLGAQRFNYLVAGRRWRKTTLVMSIAVEAASRGATVVWGAPVFDQVRVGWEETRRACGPFCVFNQSRMVVTFPSGGKIVYRSLDNPDNARGHTADGVVIDEGQDVPQAAWYEVLRPMLIDTKGWAWTIGTPKPQVWMVREFYRAADTPQSAAWQAPTLGAKITDQGLVREPHPLENPAIPFDEIVHLYETLPSDVFRQEILAEILSGEGAVFRNITANLTAPLNATPDDHKGHKLIGGVDWAQKHDYTALSVGCATCKREVALDRFNKIEWAFQRGRLAALHSRWKPATWLAEENSIGSPNIEALQREGLPVRPFVTTATSKPPLIQSLALAFERNEWQWLDIPAATAELAAYESKVSATTGRVSYSAPEGVHDDTVMARAIMLQAANGIYSRSLVTV